MDTQPQTQQNQATSAPHHLEREKRDPRGGGFSSDCVSNGAAVNGDRVQVKGTTLHLQRTEIKIMQVILNLKKNRGFFLRIDVK